MVNLMRKLEDFENPRIVELSNGLYGASFFLMKLLPARFMLEQAVEQQLLISGATICETSSGTFGLALAMLAAQHGYKLVLISDWSIDRHLQRRLAELGAKVEIVDKPASSGGFQQARLNRLGEYLKGMPDSYWPSQYSNADNPLAYGKFAELLVDRVGKIDCLVGPVGSGGSMCGTASYLRKLFPDLYTIGVDTPNSVLFGQPGGELVDLSGLGGEIVPSNVDHRHFDEVHWLTSAEVFHATHQLHRNYGLFLGPTSGAAFKVADWWSRKNPGRKAVTIFPDEGHRYVETVYDKDWLLSVPGWFEPVREEPLVVKAPTEKLTGWSSYVWGRRTLDEVLSSLVDQPPRNSVTSPLRSLDLSGPDPEGEPEKASFNHGQCGATLKRLSHTDIAAVSHLQIEPEQGQFVDPLYVVFSELRNSPHPELEHPFAITVRNEIVGFLVLCEKAALPEWAPPDAVTLHNLRIDRAYQGNGYGKAATRLAAEWISTNRTSINRLMLAVNARNVIARQAYLRSGFRETGNTHCGSAGLQNILEFQTR
ncbi:pyridoxal-phosphate dependent enzyme [Mesorhizobium sp.]|uniref:pyridoxal-phosphate dependent enzyme n=1 Tax=Mesorhizobium sp. TaxID=1871066 RepID=UPI000FE73C2E|nr:pyridoxal-phosphate dependent enzyme [Mesorhizobium sp.]RWD82941.1 MAG: pyridoxal-phosphate dependent enzyme [Mesorhizobium sp.]RWD83346.1 MAG: pyridoxal-phosphate dependent enzyme [Mesorhizobium sp.]